MNNSRLMAEVLNELETAQRINKPFNSSHEGYAVILEELDELWTEVRKRRTERDKNRMREECVQIAAMAIRFINDICDKKPRDDS